MKTYYSKKESFFVDIYADTNNKLHRTDGPAHCYTGRGGYVKDSGYWYLHGEDITDYVHGWCKEFGIDILNRSVDDMFLLRMKIEALEEIIFGSNYI